MIVGPENGNVQLKEHFCQVGHIVGRHSVGVLVAYDRVQEFRLRVEERKLLMCHARERSHWSVEKSVGPGRANQEQQICLHCDARLAASWATRN